MLQDSLTTCKVRRHKFNLHMKANRKLETDYTVSTNSAILILTCLFLFFGLNKPPNNNQVIMQPEYIVKGTSYILKP